MTDDTALEGYALALFQAVTDADHALDALKNKIQQVYVQQLTQAQQAYGVREAELQSAFDAAQGQPMARAQKLLERLRYTIAPWTVEAWQGFPDAVPADAVTGSLRAGLLNDRFPQFAIEQLPMLIPFADVSHLLVISTGPAKVQARRILQSLAARAVLQLTVPDTRFIFIDPLGLGVNFPFDELPVSARGSVVLSERDEIEGALRMITDHMRGGSDNARYVLCAADFPSRWSDDALTRLTSIAASGIAKGVNVLLHVDSDLPFPSSFTPASLISGSGTIYVTDTAVTANIDGTDVAFEPDTPPSPLLLKKLISDVVRFRFGG